MLLAVPYYCTIKVILIETCLQVFQSLTNYKFPTVNCSHKNYVYMYLILFVQNIIYIV